MAALAAASSGGSTFSAFDSSRSIELSFQHWNWLSPPRWVLPDSLKRGG
jgi:hypothetical protein